MNSMSQLRSYLRRGMRQGWRDYRMIRRAEKAIRAAKRGTDGRR